MVAITGDIGHNKGHGVLYEGVEVRKDDMGHNKGQSVLYGKVCINNESGQNTGHGVPQDGNEIKFCRYRTSYWTECPARNRQHIGQLIGQGVR